jgi:hypothetical protein
MLEVKREKGTPWTNLLDDGKPYLVLDTNSGKFYIQWWKVFWQHNIPDSQWVGSDWCDENGVRLRADQQANGWPQACRVFQLPTIEYRPAKKIITCC